MTPSAALLSHMTRQARWPLPSRVVRTTLYEIAEGLQQAYPDLDDQEFAEMMAGFLDAAGMMGSRLQRPNQILNMVNAAY